jgi:YD repeat-containing protein
MLDDLLLLNCYKMIRTLLSQVTFLACLLLIVFSTKILAQTPPSVTDQANKLMPHPVPLSPNAAALGKYGDYEVNMYNGLPDISIPLFEVKSGGISVPITLSYHASGFKKQELAGWVGLGWSVIANGQISRQVRGRPDEDHYYRNPAPFSLDACNDYFYVRDLANGLFDQDPDIFSYSYPGRSGKFILGQAHDGQPHNHRLIPYEPIRLVEEFSSNKFQKFEITDEHGMLYRFGKNADGGQSVESSNGIPTTWNLMDISSLNSNDEVKFTYQDVGTAITSDESQSITVTDNCHLIQNDNGGQSCPFPIVSTIKISSNSTNIYQTGIDEILFKEGKVKFILGEKRQDTQSGLNSLDRIEIYQKINGVFDLIKIIKFNYGYFTDGRVLDPAKLCLKLASVHICDKNSSPVQQYGFTYFKDYFSSASPHVSPSYYKYSYDYWNYFNGEGNLNLIPKTKIYIQDNATFSSNITTIGDADRTTNPQYMTDGVLKKIEYPTGGYTIFDFETHQYLEGDVATYAGGLRVKSITSSDGSNATPITKTYKYGRDESGLGEKNFYISPAFYMNSQLYRYATQAPLVNLEYTMRTFFSNSAISMADGEGSTVVYPFVTEYYGDPSQNIGKVTYEYSFFDSNGWQVVPMSNKSYKDLSFWNRGKLKLKSVYDVNGFLLSKTEIQYSTYKSTSAQVVGYGAAMHVLYAAGYPAAVRQFNYLSDCGDYDGLEFTVAPFTQTTGAIREVATVETTYKSGDLTNFLQQQTSKQYDNTYLQIIESKTARSKDTEEVVTKTKYPFHYSLNSTATGNAIGPAYFLSGLNTKGIRSVPIEQYTFVQNKDGSNGRIISGKVTTYKTNPANEDQLVQDKIFILESSQHIPFSTFKETQYGLSLFADPAYTPNISFNIYDFDGNIKEVNKADDQPVAYIWGYNNALPIAEATNASSKNIFHTSFEEDITNISVEGKTGKQSATSGFSKTLTALSGGDYRLSYFKKQGSDWVYQQTTVTVSPNGSYDISLDGQVDEVRFHPIATQMTTYTYEPLRGMTSSTDANNITTHYTYDAFGRLVAIKDNDLNLLKTFKYNYKTAN